MGDDGKDIYLRVEILLQVLIPIFPHIVHSFVGFPPFLLCALVRSYISYILCNFYLHITIND